MIVEFEVHAGISDHPIGAVAHAPFDHFVIDAEIHQSDRDRLGALREQMQLDVVVLGRGAAQHRADQARLEIRQHLHGATARRCAVRRASHRAASPPNSR